MTYPATGSTLDNVNISTGLSTQIVIRVGAVTVGAVQQLQVAQNRPIYRGVEIGLDGTLELVPNQRTEVTLNITRLVFDRLRLPEAFERGFINIHAQRFPFDIQVLDRSGGDGENIVTHEYKNCWFQQLQTPYNADNYIILETATIQVEAASSTAGDGNKNVANGGVRGFEPSIDDYEREADRGERRGTMDVPGVIAAAFSEE